MNTAERVAIALREMGLPQHPKNGDAIKRAIDFAVSDAIADCLREHLEFEKGEIAAAVVEEREAIDDLIRAASDEQMRLGNTGTAEILMKLHAAIRARGSGNGGSKP